MFAAIGRREFLRAGAGAVAAGGVLGVPQWLAAAQAPTAQPAQPNPKRPRVAAIYTWFTHRSHAHVILENFFHNYLFNGKITNPGVDVVSIYADQTAPKGDLTQQVANKYKVPVYKTIREALTLGGKQLAVDAVLSIGEHGNYPLNDMGVREYPRKRFFDAIVDVMRQSNRYVPLFNDKHLSYRWDWARAMYDTCLQFQIPFLAGSSVPLAQRRPALEIQNGPRLEEAVAIHGGPFESYDFHGLEILQSLVEFRQGGEAGVENVEFLRGEALWNAATQKRWSRALADAAMAAEFNKKLDSLTQIPGEGKFEPHGILINYRDGFKATVLKLGQSATRWNIAYKVMNEKQPRATSWYVGPWNNRNLFRALSHAIQHLFTTRQQPYPVERTLLTTGILEAAVRSRHQKGERITTKHLHFGYKPRDFTPFREMGASWKIITDKTPEPVGPAAVGVGNK